MKIKVPKVELLCMQNGYYWIIIVSITNVTAGKSGAYLITFCCVAKSIIMNLIVDLHFRSLRKLNLQTSN